MKLKLEDFKKSGWTVDKLLKTAVKETDNYSVLYSNSRAFIYFDWSNIKEVQLDIDDICTVEELEVTAKELYSAIKGLE